MFVLFLKETRHFYIKSYLVINLFVRKAPCGVSWQKFLGACWHTDFSRDAELQVFKIRPRNFGAMENRQLPTYHYPTYRRWGKLADFFLQFFSISQFRVNEHCKQIRSIHRELKSEFDLFIQFEKTCGQKIKINSQKVTLPTSPPLPYFTLQGAL